MQSPGPTAAGRAEDAAGPTRAGPGAVAGSANSSGDAMQGLTARHVWWAGLAVSLLLVALLLAFLNYQRNDRIKAQQSRSTLLARVLEDHATRSIETAALALSALGEVVVNGRAANDGAMGWVLNQTLAGLPVLRALAVVDSQGRVLAATEPTATALTIDKARLGPWPRVGSDALGRYIPGRGIASLAAGAANAAAPPGVGFVPLLRTVQSPRYGPLLLVGLINPDAIANHQQQVLADEGASALLLALDGQVLAATALAALQPGQTAASLPVFTRYLPRVEHGSYVGAGTSPGAQVLAFRASRTRPVLALVEVAEAHALAEWRQESLGLGAALLLVLAAIGVMTLLTARSLQARETARAQRDAAHSVVARREGELSSIAASVQELLFLTDCQGRLVFVNARWGDLVGLDSQQVLGRTLAQLVLPQSADTALALFADSGPKGLRTGLVHIGHAGPEGPQREFQVAMTPLQLGADITGFAGSAVDVTEQRQTQNQLRSQLAFTELLLEVMPVPLSIIDTQGRYVSVNQAWLEFTGRSRSAAIGQPVRHFQSAADAQVHDEQDRRLLAEGGRAHYHGGTLRGDGQRRELAITKAAVPGPDGRPSGVLAVFMDVTEFRDAERATRQARDAAEDASRSKSEFIANISHELRTPLQSILGFSELGQMRSAEQPRLNRLFDDIQAAGQRMLALVNDLLDVAKIESTVGSLQCQRQDLRPLVHEVLAELAPQLAARQLRTELQLGDMPLVAEVDPKRIQQVLRNVIANAVRFSPPGAALRVEAGVEPGAQHGAESGTESGYGAGGRIRLSVVDAGPGIPAAELEQIFDAFVQSSRTKDGSGGTGLGLTISRKILQAHGGEIHAENNARAGATFHIYLPAVVSSP